MYSEHVPLLRECGRTPEGFAAVVSFAIGTQISVQASATS